MWDNLGEGPVSAQLRHQCTSSSCKGQVTSSPPVWEPLEWYKITCSQTPEMERGKGHGQKLVYLARVRRQDESTHGTERARHESGYKCRMKEDRRNGIEWIVQQSQIYRKSILRFQLSLGHLSAAPTSKINTHESVYDSKGPLWVCSYSNELKQLSLPLWQTR